MRVRKEQLQASVSRNAQEKLNVHAERAFIEEQIAKMHEDEDALHAKHLASKSKYSATLAGQVREVEEKRRAERQLKEAEDAVEKVTFTRDVTS